MAALWVLANHATDVLWLGNSRHNVFVFLAHSAAQYAHLAVTLFILLSGFCLMLPVVREGQAEPARSFFRRRCRRILPPYFAALLLSVPIWIGSHHPHPGPLVRDVVGHVLLLQDVFIPGYVWDEYSLNPPLWSIAVEWHVYLFFPLLVLLWRRLGTMKTLFYAGTCAGLLWYANQEGPLSGMNLLYYAVFALGMMTASIAFAPSAEGLRERIRPACRFWPLGFLAFTLALAWIGWDRYQQWRPLIDVPFALIAAALLLRGSTTRVKVWTPLVRLGGFSYSLYLIHSPLLLALPPILRRVSLDVNGGGGGLIMAFLICPAIILCAYGFYLLVERPFLTRRRQPSLSAAPMLATHEPTS